MLRKGASMLSFTEQSFTKGKDIMPSKNCLQHLKRRTIRPFTVINAQHANYFPSIKLIGIYVHNCEWTGVWAWETFINVKTIFFSFYLTSLLLNLNRIETKYLNPHLGNKVTFITGLFRFIKAAWNNTVRTSI